MEIWATVDYLVMFRCTKDIGGKQDLTQAVIAINARLVTSQPPPCFHMLPGCVREGHPWNLTQEQQQQQLRLRSRSVYLWLQLQRGGSAQLQCRCGSSFPVVFSEPHKRCSSRTSWFAGGITGFFFCEFVVVFWNDTSFQCEHHPTASSATDRLWTVQRNAFDHCLLRPLCVTWWLAGLPWEETVN